MKTKSVKAKGRKLQNTVRDALRDIFVNTSMVPKLEDDDIKSQTMGMTGEDIVMSPAAKRIIPYSFECKNVERLNIWSALEQAESNCGKRTPVTIIKRNHTKTYAVIEFDRWLELIESAEKTLPHEDRIRNLIGFLSNLENSVNGQIEMLEEELSNFTTDKSKN